jgi:glycosyltransferase involved in cell wall biosynthesis
MNPVLSLVICTYNREDILADTLYAVTHLNASKEDFELILVNNNSPDHTDEICKQFMVEHPEIHIKYAIEYNQGHSYARNRGIQESEGKIVSFIDDDAFVHPDYVKHIIQFFEQHPQAQVAGGRIIPEYEGATPSWMSPFLLPLVAALDMGDHVRKFSRNKYPIGANIIFRKEVFEEFGLFNPELGRIGTGLAGGDEKDMVFRVRAIRDEVYYIPDVIVYHQIPQKRLTRSYIKGMAVGVGRSEKIRLKGKSKNVQIRRFIEELIKIGGTIVISGWYLLQLKWAKSKRLIEFRWWVIKGFYTTNEINIYKSE